LRQEAPDKETIYYCYVINEARKLVGFISLKDLILAPASRRVGEIMETDVVSARADEECESAARKLGEYDLLALPIVDAEDRLVGIVTHDDVLDFVVEAATEDVYRMGAVEPLGDSYLRTSFLTLWGKRGFWLAILFVGGFLTTSALTQFEHVYERTPALVLFLTLVISAGGNTGSQSATLVTRALALGELRPSDWFRVLAHETVMGLSLGFTLAAVGFMRAWFTPSSAIEHTDLWRLAEVVALSIAVVVLIGNLLGALLPLLVKRMGFDPGLMSNPVMASLVDVTGTVTYFLIAQSML
jgi:magnesium transporter